MSQGIIQAWKLRYNTTLLAVQVGSIGLAQQLPHKACAWGMKTDTMGLAEGYPAHLLELLSSGERDACEGVS